MPVTISECNSHGHMVLTFTGRNLTGQEEIARIENEGNKVGDDAKTCLRKGYNRNHRLIANETYRIALIRANEISHKPDRTTLNVRILSENYGYVKSKAGIIPHVLEVLSDRLLRDMHINYIAALHTPICDSAGYPHMLYARYGKNGHWIITYWDRDTHRWDDNGAFAFPIA